MLILRRPKAHTPARVSGTTPSVGPASGAQTPASAPIATPNIESTLSRIPSRIAVMGTSGSGKTTLARAIADAIGAPHVELDALFHGPNWTPAEPEVFRGRVLAATAGERWVSDGNYSTHLADVLWPRAEMVVWLDYPFRIVFPRLLGRTLRRARRREVLWNGNRESLREHFFTKQSLLLWAFNTHWKHRREYPARFARYPHIAVVRLERPRDAERFVAQLRALASP